MGRRIYQGGFDTITIGTAVQDVFSLLASSTKGVQIHHIHLDAAGISSAAQIRMRLKRGTATPTQGSGGTAPTPFVTDGGDAATSASAVLHCNDTTQATTSGAFTNAAFFQWDVLLPFDYMPGPEDEDREVALPGQIFVLDLPAVITATSVSGFIKWRELP